MRLDALGARLAATERNLAVIGKHLPPNRRFQPDTAPPSDTGEEEENEHA